jgi:hypothetical protein
LLRDQLHIALGPDRVVMARLGRGWRPEVVGRQEFACEAPAPDQKPWAGALACLEAGLGKLGRGKADAVVVLSNHFVRYALVPWSDQISDRDEEQAFIRLNFSRTFGAEAQHWALRMSPNGYGDTQLASAIDQELLDGLERIVVAHGMRLTSLQPNFMTAFNRWRKRIPESAAWFVVVEPGRLCVSQLEQGCWRSVRAAKTGDDWQQALLKLLEREFMVSESGTERGTVYLVAPNAESETVLPGWTVRHLDAAGEPASRGELQFAMSLNG